jgi:hypothetical protein
MINYSNGIKYQQRIKQEETGKQVSETLQSLTQKKKKKKRLNLDIVAVGL